WGERSLTYLGIVIMLGGLLGLGAANTVSLFFASSLLMGASFGALDVTLNTSISALYPQRRGAMLSLLHGFYGVGSFVGPLALSFVLVTRLSWRAAPWMVAVLFMFIGALYVLHFRSVDRKLDSRIERSNNQQI